MRYISSLFVWLIYFHIRVAFGITKTEKTTSLWQQQFQWQRRTLLRPASPEKFLNGYSLLIWAIQSKMYDAPSTMASSSQKFSLDTFLKTSRCMVFQILRIMERSGIIGSSYSFFSTEERFLSFSALSMLSSWMSKTPLSSLWSRFTPYWLNVSSCLPLNFTKTLPKQLQTRSETTKTC